MTVHSHIEPQATMDDICRAAAKVCGVSLTGLMGKNRRRNFCVPRHMAISLCLEMTGKPMAEVGKYFDRDHTTVRNARDRVAQMRGDPKMLDIIAEIAEAAHPAPQFKRDWVRLVPFSTTRSTTGRAA